MQFINFGVVRVSFFLMLGVLAAFYWPISYLALFPLLISVLLVAIAWGLTRRSLSQSGYFGILVYCSFFLLGYLSFQMRMPEFRPHHYSHHQTDKIADFIQLKIRREIKPDSYNFKYYAEVQRINATPTEGWVLLHIRNDSMLSSLPSDTNILLYNKIKRIKKPLNPYEFDYSRYLKNEGIYGEIRISASEIIKATSGNKTVVGTFRNMRSKILDRLGKTSLTSDERAIIQALILGEKKDISKALYEDYAAAGAVHILAVSGLHVGIIYLIFGFLLRPLKSLRYGHKIHSVLLVCILIGFALLSGLSPSVTRAVVMFSLFALVRIINRETNGINNLFVSFLILVLINPLWLFHVGFQLSYAAVFFILWLLPEYEKRTYSRYWLVRKLNSIVGVTLCAQVGVIPLSLYYFHQLPGLFLVTNIVILPFLSALMFGGILVTSLALLNSLPEWLSMSYNFLIQGLNGFIHWISVQDSFLFQGIHFDITKVVATYFLIIAITLLIKKMSYNKIVLAGVAVLFLISVFIYSEIGASKNELSIFYRRGETVLGYKRGKKLFLFSRNASEGLISAPFIKSYVTAKNIREIESDSLRQVFRYKENLFLLTDESGILPTNKKINTLLLTSNSKVNLHRLLDSVKPELVIADGSSYPSMIARWRESCKSKKLPFINISEQGAFSLE